MAVNFEEKLKAAGKIALGAGRIVGGIATGTGHGAVGGWLRSHHHMGMALRLAKQNIEGGLKTLQEGVEDWKDAK